MATYPNNLATYTTKTNKVDLVEASHVNSLQDEVIALQTYIGTSPQGNRDNLTARINASLSGSGGLITTNADFDGAGTYPGKFWYRTDLEVIRNVKSDNTIQTIGGSLSNLLFHYAASIGSGASGIGTSSLAGEMLVSGDLNTTSVRQFRYLGCFSGTNQVIMTGKFRKIAGISSIIVYAQLWHYSGGGGGDTSVLTVDINGTSGTLTTSTGVTGHDPQWHTATISVAGQAAGTVYPITCYLKLTGGTNMAACGSIMMFGV